MTITKNLIEKFKQYLIEEEKASATLEKYMRDITAFFVWLAGGELDKLKVLGYKEYLITVISQILHKDLSMYLRLPVM